METADVSAAEKHPDGRLPLLVRTEAVRLAEVCRAAWPARGPWRTHHEICLASRVAAERLARRLEAALREESLLAGATVRFEDLALTALGPQSQSGKTGAPERLDDLAAVARFCCNLCDGAQQNYAAMAEELQHAFEQECLCIAFHIYVWMPRHERVPSFWRYVYNDRPAWSSEDQFLFWEQMAAFLGHPWHVMAKSRLPLSLEEAVGFAPEFAPIVSLRVLAVHQSLVRAFPSAQEWQALWDRTCASAVRCLQGQAASTARASEFLLLPIHPLNLQQVRELYGEEFKHGRMFILSGPEALIPGTPTLSLRTLVPQPPALHGFRLKLPVPVHATSLPRYVSPVEVRGSTLIGQALRRLVMPRELAWQAEDYAVHLCFGQGLGGALHEAASSDSPSSASSDSRRVYTYEEARFCSAIFRSSPAQLARADCKLVPLAAMFARPAGDGSPTLWQDFWSNHQIQDGLTWFRLYASVVLRAQLSVFLLYGVALEAHQQNTVLEVDTCGGLRRLVYQELGGGIFWDGDRLALLPVDFRKELYERDDVLEPFAKCLACLRHSMLRSHLVPLLREVSLFFGVPANQLRAELKMLIKAFPDNIKQFGADRLPEAEFASYAATTLQGLLGPGERKALLRMRLLRTKTEIYIGDPGELEEGLD